MNLSFPLKPSAVPTLVICLTWFLCAIAFWALMCRRRKSCGVALRRPTSTLPVFGNTLDTMFKQRQRLHDWIADVCRQYEGGHWSLTTMGRAPAIVLGTVDAYEDVLRTQFDAFGKGAASTELAQDFFGNGIFAVDGACWLHQRKTASHLFSLQMMRDIMEKVIMEYTTVLCRKLDDAVTTGSVIDFKYQMDMLSTDVFTRIGFGVDMGCLRQAQPDEFFRAFSRGAAVLQYRAQQPKWLWKAKRALNIGVEKQMKQDMALVNGTIYNVIHQSMEQKNRRSGTFERETKDLITLFLDKEATTITSADGQTTTVESTPELIRDMAFNFIAAGRGTTAQSLTWFLVMMNRYPDILALVQSELRREVPDLVDGRKEVPTMEDVQHLTYLEAVIKESLRINPAAPLNSRVALRDVVLRDGTIVNKGTRVIIPIYATARLTSIWGADATEFKPERWIDATTGKLISVSPFKFLPFSAGPRMCPGAKLAMMEMKIALAAMFSKFAFQTVKPPTEFTYEPSLSLPVRGPVHVHVSRLKTASMVEPQSRATAA